MDEENKKKSKKRIDWHSAFRVALQATLIDYKNVLDYNLEHPLTTKPLLIDTIIIKKRPEAVIEKQIAEIFRQVNIIEYKNPTASLSVHEFHKAFARLHLYFAIARNVEIADLTLSFVVAAHPRELFRYLRGELGYTVQERHPGVHVVTGAMIQIQVINSVKLSEEENRWLRNLNRKLTEKEVAWLSQMEKKYDSLLDLSAYRHAVLTANKKMLKMLREDKSMWNEEIREIFEETGWSEEWIKKGELKGKLEGKLETAQAMFEDGDSFEKIARVTKIPLETLKEKIAIQ